MKYTSETTIYNKDAIGDDINDAAKRADDFMEYKDGTLTVGKKNGTGWTGTRAAIDEDSFDILSANGTALASYGATTTIGRSSAAHIDIDSDSMDFKKSSDNLLSIGMVPALTAAGSHPGIISHGIGTTGGYEAAALISGASHGENMAVVECIDYEATAYVNIGASKGTRVAFLSLDTDGSETSFGVRADNVSFNNSPMVDFVIENSTDANGWRIRKWYSGKMEAWRRISVSTGTMSTGNGMPYVQKTGYAQPSGMATCTNIFATETGGYFINVTLVNVTASTFNMNIVRLASTTTSSLTLVVDVYSVGTWK